MWASDELLLNIWRAFAAHCVSKWGRLGDQLLLGVGPPAESGVRLPGCSTQLPSDRRSLAPELGSKPGPDLPPPGLTGARSL